MSNMAKNQIGDVKLVKLKEEYSEDKTVTINVKFAVQGDIRESFNEKNWTDAYNNNDNLFKMKYGIKITSEGALRKKELGKAVDSYRKASIFWTRNPKLVNPMKEKRVWVQVAKNFVPYIKLTEEEVQQELFDFNEEFTFKASELGKGVHNIGAQVYASWQKHDYVDAGNAKNSAKNIQITIN